MNKVFQRRKDGPVTFERDWEAYATGFGELDGEFWLGNSKEVILIFRAIIVFSGNNNIHLLISLARQQLRFDMRDLEGETRYAKYSTFIVRPEGAEFNLTVGDYVGTAGNFLFYTSLPSTVVSYLRGFNHLFQWDEILDNRQRK
jgi:ficolin